MSIELTQEELNTLGFNYKCCFARKGEELAKDIKRGKDCKCKNRKLVFLKALIDTVNCYKYGQGAIYKFKFYAEGNTIAAGDWTNIFPSITINNTEIFTGDCVNFRNAYAALAEYEQTDYLYNIFSNSATTGVTTLQLNSGNSEYTDFFVYLPGNTAEDIPGEDTDIFHIDDNGSVESNILSDFTVLEGFGSIVWQSSFGLGNNNWILFIEKVQRGYTTEEVNCLTETQLMDIIEYINKECDCCI